MHFYTFVGQYGNRIFARSYKDGREQIIKIPYCPSLYVKSKSENTEWKTIFDQPLDEIKFADINDAKDFIKRYKDVDNFEIYGMQNFQYQYIANEFSSEIEYSLQHMNIQTLDIECKSENGFPDITTADQELLLITLYGKNTKSAVTFGVGDFDISRVSETAKKELDGHKFEYFKFKDEYSMLKAFIGYWASNYPTIVTGWNTSKFDFPYLVNRINRILGEESVKMLSPFGVVSKRSVEIFNKNVEIYDILGIVDADYLELYKKYTYSAQESYSLEYISTEELGVGKLDYEGSFRDFYTNNFSEFTAYNLIDCIRVDQLDEKMQLIDLVMSITYLAKCNVRDTFGTVKPWDVFIYNHLHNKKVAIPPQKRNSGGEFEGAWVKDPQLGMHGWTVSFDFAALYPTIMCQWNISPDTFISNHQESYNVEMLLNGNSGITTQAAIFNASVAANGTYYRHGKIGFIPEIITKTMSGRKTAKREMLAVEQEYQKTKNENLVPKITSLNNRQLAFKILNNSLYGAISNAGFRYYELRMAEAITLTGQLSNRHIEKTLNGFMNRALKSENVDYVIAGDTDSNYLNVNDIVKTFYPDKTIDETVAWLDKFCEKAIQPLINKSINHIFELCNCETKLMDMKREAIASKALWQKKKRYGMVVHNSEGVDYKPYKLKIMGLDIIKSSTPKEVRADLKECMKIMFEDGEEKLQTKVSSLKSKFVTSSPEEIAFPRGISDIDKYQEKNGYKKGCPIHVRAAILYNKFRQPDLPPIRSGDKIKFIYLKTPNPIKEDVIGFPSSGKMPMQEKLVKFIDWETMWEKSFISPLEGLTTACGWEHTKRSTLDSFYC